MHPECAQWQEEPATTTLPQAASALPRLKPEHDTWHHAHFAAVPLMKRRGHAEDFSSPKAPRRASNVRALPQGLYICIYQGWIWVPLATAEARTPGSVPCFTHAHSTPIYTLPNAGCCAPQRQHNVMGKHNCCGALGKGGGRMHRHPLQDRK